jgi:hypothetical protein
MKALHTLIKVANMEVEAKREELFFLREKLHSLKNALGMLKENLEQEKVLVDNNIELSYAYNIFAIKNLAQQEQLKQAMKNLEAEIDQAMAQLLEAYFELKKYETVLKNRQRLTQKEEDRKEANILNDIELNKYSSKLNEA